jgi:glycine cleavage system protein P-like pyridoxal-binding family
MAPFFERESNSQLTGSVALAATLEILRTESMQSCGVITLAAATWSGSAIRPETLVPMSKCVFQGAIQHVNANIANYIRKGLEGTYDLPYSTPTMHEVVFSDKLQLKKGVRTMDLAKRLIDYGFHPYTTAFPLIVPGALMIEPTESESKEEMDLFIEAMKSIAEEVEEDPQTVLDAPHSTRVSRLDETAAARKPVLRWKPAS